MKISKTLRLLTIACWLFIFDFSAQAQQLSLTGQIFSPTVTRGYVRRFNIKLYPPKASRKPILVTTSAADGRFKFSGLSPTSYLLEVYLGNDLVYQEVVNITNNKDLKIDLRRR